MACTQPFHPAFHHVIYPDFEEIAQNLNGLGFYLPAVFTPKSESYYTRLHSAHQFNDLTESNKPGVSFRKGVYLSRVESDPTSGDLSFNLLRCSTNFQSPTENFRSVDEEIIDVAQRAADHVFGHGVPAELNHVLAQVYHNTAASTGAGGVEGHVSTKEKKARIKSHSDKTKDMPVNGVMAVCTFYSDDIAQKAKVTPDGDYVYKNGSVFYISNVCCCCFFSIIQNSPPTLKMDDFDTICKAGKARPAGPLFAFSNHDTYLFVTPKLW